MSSARFCVKMLSSETLTSPVWDQTLTVWIRRVVKTFGLQELLSTMATTILPLTLAEILTDEESTDHQKILSFRTVRWLTAMAVSLLAVAVQEV